MPRDRASSLSASRAQASALLVDVDQALERQEHFGALHHGRRRHGRARRRRAARVSDSTRASALICGARRSISSSCASVAAHAHAARACRAASPTSARRLRTAHHQLLEERDLALGLGVEPARCRALGHDASASVSPSCGSACHSSSVTNGMNGMEQPQRCRRARFHATQRATSRSCASTVSPSAASDQRGFAISRYQSQ